MYRRTNPSYGGGYPPRRTRRRRGGGLIIALVFVAFALFRYFSNTQYNEITGEKQQIGMNVEQEIALGLQSAPAMIRQHGGLYPDQELQNQLKQIGHNIVQNSDARNSKYRYDFHLLADPRTVNAFALPGGQIFITQALYSRLENVDQLAGVLGHEIGHVVGRHSAQRVSKQQLAKDLTGAAVLATGDYGTAQAAQMIANVVNMKYGRGHELQSDDLGVRFMIQAGYDPHALKDVMRILKEASGGGQRQPEFFSTHPDPENRIDKIEAAISRYGG